MFHGLEDLEPAGEDLVGAFRRLVSDLSLFSDASSQQFIYLFIYFSFCLLPLWALQRSRDCIACFVSEL